jgi:hypothetical protein
VRLAVGFWIAALTADKIAPPTELKYFAPNPELDSLHRVKDGVPPQYPEVHEQRQPGTVTVYAAALRTTSRSGAPVLEKHPGPGESALDAVHPGIYPVRNCGSRRFLRRLNSCERFPKLPVDFGVTLFALI